MKKEKEKAAQEAAAKLAEEKGSAFVQTQNYPQPLNQK